jgi:hypothetical protein
MFPLIPLPIKEATRGKLQLQRHRRQVSINSTSYKGSDLGAINLQSVGINEIVKVSINSTSYKGSDVHGAGAWIDKAIAGFH